MLAGRQPEVISERFAFVFGPEHAPLLQQRDDRGGELVEPTGGYVRDKDEPVAGVSLNEVVYLAGHGGRGTDKGLASTNGNHKVADRQVFGLGPCSPLVRRGYGVAMSADAGPALSNGFYTPTSGSISGSGPSGS